MSEKTNDYELVIGILYSAGMLYIYFMLQFRQ